MRRVTLYIALAAAAATAALAPSQNFAAGKSMSRPASAAPGQLMKVLKDWPAAPAKEAQVLITKYGAPDEVTATSLMWHHNGPWKRTILYRDEVPHLFPKAHTDFLEQVIDYRVPPDRFTDLAKYDGSVVANRTQGEMSARCDKEENNLLALNLANDVITGKKNVEEARRFYAEAINASMRGERPPYTQGFQFPLPQGGTADPDMPWSP